MKQKIVLIIGISLSLAFGVEAENDKKDTTMDRIETCKQNYTRLFGGEALTGKGSDPELMDILQKFIFGEVFETGSLDHKTREMITCVTLASMQTLPQLKSHEDNRYEKEKEIQYPLYGDEIARTFSNLPDEMNESLPRFLTEVGFGDFYTRSGLDIKTRELLSLCVLAAIGAESQIHSHSKGNIKAGNDKATQIAAMIQCLPYIGFPNALNAIRIIDAL